MKDEDLQGPSLLTSLENIWNNSVDIVKDIFRLFALEIRLAGRSLAVILMMIVLTSLLLLSSWFLLLSALVTWLVSLHLGLILSLILVSAINLFLAFLIGLYIIRISNNLRFKETRKQLEYKRGDHERITP